MKLKIISDIHLEFIGAKSSLPEIEGNTDAIGLLGDIGNPLKKEYREFLLEMSERFQHVFVISGNHEYYANKFSITNSLIEEICSQRDNIHFLNNTSVDVLGFRFLGTTLWSTAPVDYQKEIESASTDHKKIITETNDEYSPEINLSTDVNLSNHWDMLQLHGHRFTIEDKVNLHEKAVEWLQEELKKASEDNIKVVILSHHAPTSRLCLPWQVKQDKASEYDSCTDLEYLMKDNVKLWGFGHTHFNCDQIINHTTRVVSNQLGYVRRTNPSFDGSLILDLLLEGDALNNIVTNRQKLLQDIQKPMDEAAKEKYSNSVKSKEPTNSTPSKGCICS